MNPSFRRMPRLTPLWTMAALLLAGLLGCSDNDPVQRFSHLRSAGPTTVDTVPADTLCADPGPDFISEGFNPTETCRQTRKYILRYERPDDTVGFLGYRVYLDTTPGVKTWTATRNDDREAALFIDDIRQDEAGLVFFIYDKHAPPPGIRHLDTRDTVDQDKPRIYGLDTSGHYDAAKKGYVFAVAPRHGSGTPGQPTYTLMITVDVFPPAIFRPEIRVGAKSLTIDWARPNDPVSYFNPGLDTGIIKGYRLSLRLSGKVLKDRADRFTPRIRFWKGGVEATASVRDTVIREGELIIGRRWFLPDSLRAHRGPREARDSLRVIIDSLIPRETLDVVIFAEDSAGNSNSGSMPNDATVILTDSTRPTAPELQIIDSLTTRNAFNLQWKASRDSVDLGNDGTVEEGPSPNFNIREYRVRRTLVRDSGEGVSAVDVVDSVYAVTKDNQDSAVIRDSVRFLPPGRTYRITVTAVDSSGFVSATDTALVTTRSIAFADSGLTCPPGFIPIPAAKFRLGETGGSHKDEIPDRVIRMGSYCIEPFEHRDSTGRFATMATWEEANAACQAISPSDSTQLCSEMEWERACEGFDLARPHPHGIQSEGSNPAILQLSCNQATGDSAMAMSYELRNPICLTNEGVYDMAGNLMEWVRDPYNDSAYYTLKPGDSTADFGKTFPADGESRLAGVHGLRGGSYLKSGALPLAQQQAFARCSNRDFPMQTRPLFRADCKDTIPRIAVTFGSGLTNHFCFDVPDSLRAGISDLVVPKDSTKVLAFYTDDPKRIETIPIPLPDTTFRGKRPTEVVMTTLSLAVVEFQLAANPSVVIQDTLDARELRDTSEAVLERVLRRESPSKAWVPKREGGRIAIKRLYAYSVTGSKVAKANYASRNVGFRCCSKPRPAAPKTLAGAP